MLGGCGGELRFDTLVLRSRPPAYDDGTLGAEGIGGAEGAAEGGTKGGADGWAEERGGVEPSFEPPAPGGDPLIRELPPVGDPDVLPLLAFGGDALPLPSFGDPELDGDESGKGATVGSTLLRLDEEGIGAGVVFEIGIDGGGGGGA